MRGKLLLEGTHSKSIADTRWVLTWKIVDGKKDVKARSEAKGHQDPGLKNGSVET